MSSFNLYSNGGSSLYKPVIPGTKLADLMV
jgi:hypothetical protein